MMTPVVYVHCTVQRWRAGCRDGDSVCRQGAGARHNVLETQYAGSLQIVLEAQYAGIGALHIMLEAQYAGWALHIVLETQYAGRGATHCDNWGTSSAAQWRILKWNAKFPIKNN